MTVDYRRILSTAQVSTLDGFSKIRSFSLPELRCNAYAHRTSFGRFAALNRKELVEALVAPLGERGSHFEAYSQQ